MSRWRTLVPLVAALTTAACAPGPHGPSVMVLPGSGKPLEQFQADDGACRQWAAQRTTGDRDSVWMVQRRYDIAYQQCMYAKGHQIPMAARYAPRQQAPQHAAPPPPPPGTPPPPPPAKPS